MSRNAHKLISASGGKAYEIDQSLLCSQSDGSKLRRTPSSEGNRKTFTFSTWCKRGKLGLGAGGSNFHYLLGGAKTSGWSDDSHYFAFGFFHTDTLAVGGWSTNWRITNRVFRDTAAWMHLVLQFDTTQGTADNRVKIYVNGVQETSFGTSNNPSQNYDVAINNTVPQSISDSAYDSGTGPYHFDGYMAETHFFDGAVVAPSEFGETSDTGQWIPKKYVGTTSYGTNGYYMPFKKNDRYSPYFDGSSSSGITTPDHSDFNLGTNNFTLETWFYRDEHTGSSYMCGQHDGSNNSSRGVPLLYLEGADKPKAVVYYNSGNNYMSLIGSSALAINKWHHMALVRNGNVFTLYVNGTAAETTTTSITLMDSSAVMGVGSLGAHSSYRFKGWLSNFRLVNGTAVYTSNFTPSTSPLTAITNTVLLCCQDVTITAENSGTSKTLTVGTPASTYTQQMSPFTYDWYQDQSGQDNHYQPDNLTVNDIMLDSPTNNFATLNPEGSSTTHDITQGNLQAKGSDANNHHKLISTIAPTSGKWYCEYYVIQVQRNSTNIGASTRPEGAVVDSSNQNGISLNDETTWRLNYHTDGQYTAIYRSSNKEVDNLDDAADGDICSIAIDADNSKVYFRRNNTIVGSSDGYTINTLEGGDSYFFAFYPRQKSAYRGYGIVNFGQNSSFAGYKISQGNTDDNGVGDFYYSPPSGFKALCSKNLPSVTIKKPTEHFNTVLYTGDASSEGSGDEQAITGVGFQPDLVWLKARSTGADHLLQDVLRGPTKYLRSNTTDAEGTQAEGLKSFDSDGFTVGDSNSWNQNNRTLVSWNWKAGGSGSSNTDGAQTTTVSANTTAGFSIVTFTGTGSATTFGHGLGVVPKVYIMKRRDSANYWWAGTTAVDGSLDFGELDTNAAFGASSLTVPTSSVFYSDGTQNTSSATYVAYVFAEVEGFSKFGSYTGNGSTDGPYINLGFRPAYVLIKDTTDASYNWKIFDNKRQTGNLMNLGLWTDLANAESTSSVNIVDFYSNGFKLRGSGNAQNKNNNVLFYMAFAESPFKYANAR